MHPWGVFPEKDFGELAVDAVTKALADAKITWGQIEAMAAGIHGWSGSPGLIPGNVVANALGETGIPVVNVYAACATSVSALRQAYQMVSFGMCDMAIAVGAEKTPGGFFPAIPRLAESKKFDYWALRFKAVGATNPGRRITSSHLRRQRTARTERSIPTRGSRRSSRSKRS
jgi:hypothetical protein